jgi:HAD superfamily hydrolase (TIGR01662 family)
LIRAVLIDLGDTLVHMSRPWDDVFRQNVDSLYTYLKASGIRTSFEDFSRIFVRGYESASTVSQFYKIEIPMQDIMSRVFSKVKLKDHDDVFIYRAMTEFYKPEIEAWELYPDTVDTLTALGRQFDLGLISNAKSDWAVNAILDKHNLRKFFKVILTSAGLRKRKPRADVFTEALKALNVKPSEAVFIGDSLQADILGAKTVGMGSIHVLRNPSDEDSIFVTPDFTVTSLTDALSRIISWPAFAESRPY